MRSSVLELFLLLLEKAELVRLVKFVSAVLTFVLLPEITFLAACVGRDDLNRLPQHESSCNHKSRTSLLNTQKNRKMKKPWKALKITKRTWKAVEALESPNPVTVRAPKSHVRPKRNMTPAILMSNLMVVFTFICCLACSSVFRVCVMRTPITMMKMTKFKSKMAKMGPRKAPKNTAGSKTKQLERGMRTPSIYQCWLVLKYMQVSCAVPCIQ